jgi:5-methylcytosine-specific restriction endonuclease McrA
MLNGVEVIIAVTSRPLCERCTKNYARKRIKADGTVVYRKYCTTCGEDTERRKARENKTYTLSKKDYCENCGFVAVHSCQLDVDHIDGDKNNNAPSNHQTLCANCHRLKTFLERDFVAVKYRNENDKQETH